jgi:hypothetical protein
VTTAAGPSVVMGDWGPWLGIDPETRKRTVVAQPAWYVAGDAERAVLFQPGYRTDRKTYGRHGMEITWLLRGGLGVTQFKVFTDWDPGLSWRDDVLAPSGADLGYHALVPQYEGHNEYDCTLLVGSPKCFYDGSGLAADDLLSRFLIKGEDVVWQTLRERHDRLIGPTDSNRSGGAA